MFIIHSFHKMKYLILLIISLNIFLTPVKSQWQRCVGRPCKFILNIPNNFKRNVSKTIFLYQGLLLVICRLIWVIVVVLHVLCGIMIVLLDLVAKCGGAVVAVIRIVGVINMNVNYGVDVFQWVESEIQSFIKLVLE